MPPVTQLAPVRCVLLEGAIGSVAARGPQPIVFAQDEDVVIPLQFEDEAAEPADISNALIVFTVRLKATTTVLISRYATITDGGNGLAEVQLSQTDTGTTLSTPGLYVYDVSYEQPITGDRAQVVPLSRLVLLPSVGRVGDPTDTFDPQSLTGFGLPSNTGHAHHYLRVLADESSVEWNNPFPAFAQNARPAPGDDGETSIAPRMIFNSTTHQVEISDGSNWYDVNGNLIG